MPSTMPSLENLIQKRISNMNLNSRLKRIFDMVFIKRECFVNDLWELIGYETVSTRYDGRHEMQRAVDWLLKRMIALGVVAFGENMGMQIITDTFKTIRMPQVIIGMLRHCANRHTILVYGNLDVAEAIKEDGWVSHPFVMMETGNYLYGRGVALDKGPLMCWLNAVQAYRDAGLRLPINIIFLIESMAHSGSMGLHTVLQQRISFFREVSCVVMATRRWQSQQTPCIVYGSRGVIYYHLEVQCANRSLSSCEHGGTLFEAMPDLFYLLSSLTNCQMQHIFKSESSHIDRSVFRTTDFNYYEFGQSLDVDDLPYQGQKQVALSENWGMPHISIHGIEGTNADGDIRFIIPHKVVGKFSISLAPNQDPAQATNTLQQHLGEVWRRRGSPNKMQLQERLVIPSWTGRSDSPEYRAATQAMLNTFQMNPNLIRDGGALLPPTIFQEHLKKNVLVLPVARNDSGGAPINERLSVENYMLGSQLMAAFMWEYAEVMQQEEEARNEIL